MNRTISIIVLFGVAGLVIGYLIFGRSGGSYVSVQALIAPSEGIFGRIGETVRGIPEIRRNILVSGAVGVAAGLVLNFVRR